MLLSTMVWSGGLDGNGTNYRDSANWAGNVLPGANDVASIGNTGNRPDIWISVSVDVMEIDTLRSLVINSGSIAHATILGSGGALLKVNSSGTFDGVTATSDLELLGSFLYVQNGLMLQGSNIWLGNGVGASSGGSIVRVGIRR